MRRPAAGLCVLLVLGLPACTRNAPPPAHGGVPPVPTDSHAHLVVQPMALIPDQILNPTAAPLLVLSSDGVITAGDVVVGHFAGDRVTGAHDEEILALSDDGTMTVRGAAQPLRLRDDGDVEVPPGTRLSVGTDGTVTFISSTGERAPGPVRVRGVTPSTRATAAALVLIEMQRRQQPSPGLGTPALRPPSP